MKTVKELLTDLKAAIHADASFAEDGKTMRNDAAQKGINKHENLNGTGNQLINKIESMERIIEVDANSKLPAEEQAAKRKQNVADFFAKKAMSPADANAAAQ